jgi:8-oxo-dGTP pyrophosphatase MutT (NUDIX family)
MNKGGAPCDQRKLSLHMKQNNPKPYGNPMLLIFQIASLLLLIAGTISHVEAAAKCHHGGLNNKGGKVSRAGILIIKHYSKHKKDYAIFVGENIHTHHKALKNPKFSSVWNFPGGKYDAKKDKLSTHTAMREYREEFHVPAPSISHKTPYIYSNRGSNAGNPIQLFFVRNDGIKTTVIHHAIQTALKNPALPTDQREINDCRAIPIQNILNAAKATIAAGFPDPSRPGPQGRHHPCYFVKSRSGQLTRIEAYYLQAIAREYQQAKKHFNALCPGANFQ